MLLLQPKYNKLITPGGCLLNVAVPFTTCPCTDVPGRNTSRSASHSSTDLPYLRRLDSGWEALWPLILLLPPVPDDPLPLPVDCRFPERSFSTAARFPVRAASRSSCSFPISDREGGRRIWERGGWKAGEKILCGPLLISQTYLFFQRRRKRWFPPPLDQSLQRYNFTECLIPHCDSGENFS